MFLLVSSETVHISVQFWEGSFLNFCNGIIMLAHLSALYSCKSESELYRLGWHLWTLSRPTQIRGSWNRLFRTGLNAENYAVSLNRLCHCSATFIVFFFPLISILVFFFFKLNLMSCISASAKCPFHFQCAPLKYGTIFFTPLHHVFSLPHITFN